MKRLVILFVVVAFVAAIPLTHSLMAAKEAKVWICHVTSYDEVADMHYGHLLEISEKSWPAHQAHDDVLAESILKFKAPLKPYKSMKPCEF